ncbi:MAG: hypothetical protein JWP18_310, partial [Solirubrobacterales bacterium]|nr:hypothetical protein [Solirubrobacterales bacterium]
MRRCQALPCSVSHRPPLSACGKTRALPSGPPCASRHALRSSATGPSRSTVRLPLRERLRFLRRSSSPSALASATSSVFRVPRASACQEPPAGAARCRPSPARAPRTSHSRATLLLAQLLRAPAFGAAALGAEVQRVLERVERPARLAAVGLDPAHGGGSSPEPSARTVGRGTTSGCCAAPVRTPPGPAAAAATAAAHAEYARLASTPTNRGLGPAGRPSPTAELRPASGTTPRHPRRALRAARAARSELAAHDRGRTDRWPTSIRSATSLSRSTP